MPPQLPAQVKADDIISRYRNTLHILARILQDYFEYYETCRTQKQRERWPGTPS